MKRVGFLLIVSVLMPFCATVKAGSGDAKAPAYSVTTGKSAAFAGTWKGNEQCQSVSAPVAIVVITANGPDQVFITGIYSLQGKVKGTIKGNTIIIPRQAVDDPNFKNIAIEGSLTMGNGDKNLTGVLSVLNNDQKDGCTVNYRRQ